jgi:D-glycero-D-manno-heptose 1,7-bisphosphate phosphatase
MSEIEAAGDAGIVRLFFGARPQDTTLRPAIFLDRDGVINEKIAGGYVTRWSEFRFTPHIVETLVKLAASDVPVIVISNQACVGKGLVGTSLLAEITCRFVSQLRSVNARIDAVYYCPHLQEYGCGCRKPRAGLLQAAALDWRLDLGRSVFIGDSISDMQAARTAGCRGILLHAAVGPDPRSVADMPAVRKILDVPGNPGETQRLKAHLWKTD